MNSISFDTRITNGAAHAAGRLIAGRIVGIAPADIPVDWLPAPAVKTGPAQGRPTQEGCRALWVQPQSHTAAEKVFVALLAVAAVIGIAYGFSCFVDFVQNWAAVSTGIRNFI